MAVGVRAEWADQPDGAEMKIGWQRRTARSLVDTLNFFRVVSK
jgi:hypothetical protein